MAIVSDDNCLPLTVATAQASASTAVSDAATEPPINRLDPANWAVHTPAICHDMHLVMNGMLSAYPGVSLSIFGQFASCVVLIVLRCLANLFLVLKVQ